LQDILYFFQKVIFKKNQKNIFKKTKFVHTHTQTRVLMFFKCVVEFNFERFVIQKFQHLEIKISNIQKQMEQVLYKLCKSTQEEQKIGEEFDIFQHLPLKDENDLEALEFKLGDVSYRHKMVNIITFILKSISLRERYNCSLKIGN